MESSPSSNIKFYILIALCLQNCCHAVVTRYSRSILHETWSDYEVVMSAEIVKLFVAGFLMFNDHAAESDAKGQGIHKVIWLLWNGKKMLVLVTAYTISNVSSYAALQRLDPAVYTVLSQLKLFTTAIFASCFLSTYFSNTKIRALINLALGGILVTSPNFNKCELLKTNDGGEKQSFSEFLIGISACLLMVTISGASSIYFEKVLKKDEVKLTIWERNVQLAFYSWIVVSLICSHQYVDWEFVSGTRSTTVIVPFQGWSVYTVLIVFLQALGGILVAATLKYADSVVKNFSIAGSITLSTIISYFFLNGVIDLFVIIGIISTIIALFNYSFDMTPTPPTLPASTSDAHIKVVEDVRDK